MVAHKLPEEMFQAFLERVASGEPVTHVCRDPKMPSWGSISNKIASDPAFEAAYRLALEFRGMVLADELDDIKREAKTGLIDPASARVAADILKWQAARMTPKMYGDRQQVDVQAVKGGSYLDLLTKVNDAAKKDKLLESKEDTQPDIVRARDEINQKSVNKKMHKKQAKQAK